MTVIRLGGFRGEIPRVHPRLLPEGAAQVAVNCRLDSGGLESIKGLQNLQATILNNPISLYRYSANVWLESVQDNDWVQYPVVNDAFGRLIYINPTVNEVRVTDASRVGTGGDIQNYYRLDVPAPSQGFAAAIQGTADDNTEVPETRFYVCTFVNSYGAEGPPSPPTNEVEWRSGQTVSITGLPTAPAGTYNITHRRLYRINTGTSGATNYQFVTEISIAQNSSALSTVTKANPAVVTTATPHGFTSGQEILMSGLGLDAAQNVTGILKQNPVRVTVPGHGYSNGDYVEMGDLGSGNGMDELNGNRYQIAVVDSDRFDLTGIDGTAYVAWVMGGTASKVFGMDELEGNSYFISVINATSFTLDGIDSTGFFDYRTGGQATQVYGNSYIDAIPSASLAEVLPTENYDPPNPALRGVKEHPAGFLVGFFGKTLCFSEPGAPHAWPLEYRLVTSHDIIGIGIFGNTVAITTKGWPYLAIGSDPSAMAMVELEVEQSCASKRGIVDFGSAIAYPSPDGLMLISGDGAQNLTAALFTRDQWQALDPTTFLAFNWEQKYLCFYDDGTDQRGFLIDPFAPADGVRYIEKYATGGYKDIEEDLLYLIVNNQIEIWDQGTALQYEWKSKPVYLPHSMNMSAAKVIADSYPITMDLYVDDVLRHTAVVQGQDAFRLPGGYRGEKFEVSIRGVRRVSEVTIATSMTEIAATV